MIISGLDAIRHGIIGATISVPEIQKQVPIVINEILAQEVIKILGQEADYTYFEAWKSRNKAPGFAVYQSGPVLAIKHYTKSNFRVATNDSGLTFGIEAPTTTGLEAILKKLKEVSFRQLKTPPQFYEQTNRELITLEHETIERLEVIFGAKDPLEERGRYLLAVKRSGRAIPGHYVRLLHPLNTYNIELLMTSQNCDEPNSYVAIPLREICSIYGKGFEQLYAAKTRQGQPELCQ